MENSPFKISPDKQRTQVTNQVARSIFITFCTNRPLHSKRYSLPRLTPYMNSGCSDPEMADCSCSSCSVSVRHALLAWSHLTGPGKGRVKEIKWNIAGMETGSALGNGRRRPNETVRSMVQGNRTPIGRELDPVGREPRPGGGSKAPLIHHLCKSGLNAVKKLRCRHAVGTLLVRISGQPRIAAAQQSGMMCKLFDRRGCCQTRHATICNTAHTARNFITLGTYRSHGPQPLVPTHDSTAVNLADFGAFSPHGSNGVGLLV